MTLTLTGGHPQSQIARLNNRETTLPKSESGKLLTIFENQSPGVADCVFGVWLRLAGLVSSWRVADVLRVASQVCPSDD